jgi:hypothetical protein
MVSSKDNAQSKTKATEIKKKGKDFTFLPHIWTDRTKGEFRSLCDRYAGTADQGKWIADPASLRASKKLYCKAEKHGRSVVHRMPVEANKTRCSE